MKTSLTRRAAGLAALAVVAFAAACATKPDVRHDLDPAADLGTYKTFAFYDAGSASYESLLEQRLRQATRAQLERQRYVYDERNPDLRVNYALHVIDKQELQSIPAAGRFGGYRGWNNHLQTVEYRQGTLAIDLVDAKRNALVWRAVAEGRLDSKAIEQPGPTIDAAVGELFARFPGAKGQ
jgi:Domain of unknown function (DUF4136)